MSKRETRAFPVEIRADDGQTITGHAATFNDPYPVWDFDEVIARGAFDRAIKEDDVRALWNHDSNHVLGRTKSDTLRLSTDKVGLVSEIDLPNSAEMVREAIQRGDVDHMSFGFEVEEEEWKKGDEGERDLRTVKSVKLWDVSPVTYPANPNTDVALRSHEAFVESLKPEKGHSRRRAVNRMKTLDEDA